MRPKYRCKLKLYHIFVCGLFFLIYCLEKTSTQHLMLGDCMKTTSSVLEKQSGLIKVTSLKLLMTALLVQRVGVVGVSVCDMSHK